MNRFLTWLMLGAMTAFGQVKKPIDPVKPAVKARFVIDHQNITVNKVEYADAKLIYEFKPILLEKCNKEKLISEIDAIKENADKLTVEYRDKRLGKMSQVYLGAMPIVKETGISEVSPK